MVWLNVDYCLLVGRSCILAVTQVHASARQVGEGRVAGFHALAEDTWVFATMKIMAGGSVVASLCVGVGGQAWFTCFLFEVAARSVPSLDSWFLSTKNHDIRCHQISRTSSQSCCFLLLKLVVLLYAVRRVFAFIKGWRVCVCSATSSADHLNTKRFVL